MLFKIGDLVSRNSYNNDTVFKVVSYDNDLYYLTGVDVRLCADSPEEDLKLVDPLSYDTEKEDQATIDNTNEILNLDRSSFFYLPGKILHIDGDEEYLERCMKFYRRMKVQAYGVVLKEKIIAIEIEKYLKELHPDIVIITGHDYFYKNKKDTKDINNYRNSKFFIEAVKKVREYEKSQDKLVIISGACQSNYEELIKAGSNFASSPKRVNIHALDPAIIASSIALSPRDKSIDIIKIISKTKYKEEGVGGIITNGMMYTGYPR